MSKPKTKFKKYSIGLSVLQKEMLDYLLDHNGADNVSGYIGTLIVKEYRNLEAEKNRPKAGRPKKETEEDEVAYIPHPDTFMNKGRLITETEYETYYALRNEVAPNLKKYLASLKVK